jgi:hypothetical protein
VSVKGTTIYNSLLKKRWRGWEEKEECISSYWITFRNIDESGNTGLDSVGNSLCNGLWICHKTDYRMK